MKDKTKSVIEFLKKVYGAEVIIVVGSRAVGDYKETTKNP